ncbi:uncharacterized protein LOC110846046 isoform X2 [Folsomia candida]|uniref:uncharacterized protein LOC110846046 isoform X2 n=1 Tax=Folsomia candida TaxID=158441 RepID=UPI001605471D|nr:uncharacterized protein LOC110846046 isoform X2 [Folsomia candida]
MNKLNKYKKPPAIKLPAPPKKPVSTTSKKIFEVSSDSEDDDFQKPRSKEFAAPARQRKNKSDEQNNIQIHITNPKQIKGSDGVGKSRKEKNQSKSITSTSTTITSEYIYVPDDKKIYIPDKNKIPEDDILESPVGQSKKRSCKAESPIRNTNNGKKDNKVHATEENYQEGNIDADLESMSTKVAHRPEAVCPFCWKHLTDKLAGSVHIKACAKNLPLNQIFEALQLQEKQIKEWEGLGIAYPGFHGGPSSSAAVGSRRGGCANSRTGNKASRPTRRKKQDPELELAIALSESLHEEVERRKQNENAFIVENDLQGEIEIRPVIQIPNIMVQQTKSKPSKPVRRGKRGNLALLPLCTATDSDKKSEIEKRLGTILDESEANCNKHEDFNVRENPSHGLLQLSKRLEKYKIKTSPLWSLASSASSSFDSPRTYSISAVSDAKSRLLAELGNSVQTDLGSLKKVHTTSSPESTRPNCVVPEVKIVSNSSRLQNNKCEITPPKVITVDAPNLNNNCKSSSSTPLLSKLSNDLLQIFVNKEMTDLTVYGREEKPIKAHKLIIMARCRKLYSEIVQENTSNGKTVRDIISLTCFSHLAVKAFVKFLYCGKLKPLEGQDFLDVLELGSRYGIQLTEVVVTTSTTSTAANTTTTNSAKSGILVEDKHRSTPQLVTPPTHHNLPISKCTTRESVDLDKQHCVELMCSTSINKPPNLQLRESCNRNRSVRSNMSLDLFLDEEDALKTETNLLGPKNDKSMQQQNIQECTLGNQNDKDDDDDDNEDAGSRDMFEDLEDFEEEYISELKINNEDQQNPVSTKHKNSDADDDNSKIIIDDELNPVIDSQHRVLLSPKHYKSPQDLASLFPPCYNFTTSQVAGYIDFISSLNRDESQANKKHKLIDIEEIDDDNVVLNIYSDSSRVVNLDQSKKTFKKLKKDSSSSSFQREIMTLHESHVATTLSECNNSFQLSPLNSYRDPCVFPEQYGQSPSCVDRVEPVKENIIEDDPFGNDDDDCFLNLPSVLLQNHSPLPPCPSPISNKKNKSAVPQSDLVPIPSRSNTDTFSQNLELNCQNPFNGKGKAERLPSPHLTNDPLLNKKAT